MIEPSGRTANLTGANLENFIEQSLVRKKYTYIEPGKFVAAMYLEQPIFTHKMRGGTNIYGITSEYDFVLYHPQKHPEGLIIEVKWQQSGGTVDEKFPYLVLNIKSKYPYKTIVLLDGQGYRKGAEKWLRLQIQEGENLL